jgi:hypothetical protein
MQRLISGGKGNLHLYEIKFNEFSNCCITNEFLLDMKLFLLIRPKG